MSYVGETSKRESLTHPDLLIGESIKVSSQQAVRSVMQSLPTSHWSFARNMEVILPFALESISPTDSFCTVEIPSLQATHIVRPKESLSAGLKISLHRRMIVDDKVTTVAMLAFNKYSSGVKITGYKEVSLKTIMDDYRFWQNSAKLKFGQVIDFQSLIELHLLTFLKDGFAIYNASSLNINQKDYYRINIVKDDILVECIVTLDDYYAHLGYSSEEQRSAYS